MEFKRGKWNSREEFQEWKIQESGKYLNMQRNMMLMKQLNFKCGKIRVFKDL